MSIRILACSLFLGSCLGLSGCSEGQQPGPMVSDSPALNPAVPFDTGITIREIMDSLVDPHADALWNSVRVISDSTGIHEYQPETEEDWATLRISAVSIIEGANALMMPGRRVAPPGAQGEYPEHEFTPEEVEVALAADRQSWVGFAQGLQNSARQILNAIDARDVEGLSDGGAIMDEACEACHSHYWYRAGI